MKKNSFLILSALALVAAVSVACSDDEEETTLEYLSGSVTYSSPAYVYPGETYNLKASGITAEDGAEVSYSWTCSPDPDSTAISKVVSDGSCVFTVPDTLCMLTITCTAKADGYYSSSSSAYPMVVGRGFPSSSLVRPELPEDVLAVTDTRDNLTYTAVPVGGTYWFCENLAYSGAGISFYDSYQMDAAFGRLYTFEEVKSTTNPLCPSGWHVSTDADWVQLAKYYDKTTVFAPGESLPGVAGKLMSLMYFNDERLWEFVREVRADDNSPFCSVPAGYANVGEDSNTFSGALTYAVYWTQSEKDADTAYCRYLYYKSPDIRISAHDQKSFGASVRCVQD